MTPLAFHLAAAAAGWSPENWVAVIVAAGALLGTAITGLFAFRTSVRTNKTQERMAEQSATIERAKVVSEAFEQAKAIYDHAIDELREELDRVRAQHEKALEQLDRLSEKLQAERGTNQEIRDELHSTQREMGEMRTRMAHMDRLISTLRRQLVEAGLTPTEPVSLEGA
ncbi:hypothetical protein [Microbispora sp. GKU 823]|uniref:hypothetical protein n=1 Tax=Microbispora sp. GKU 823 TaxID=1652100 RepID=UPI0009A372F6|nr:hypothetical protein [Microbispora sp. GKU 823]OPG10567.1 hypothetical protein B1L11_23185 [Microbispora sp. GKU 823]